jgi:hypothetical protein
VIYIKGFNRNRAVLIPETIDLIIDKNNEIIFIDSFVDSFTIVVFGFKEIWLNKNGRRFHNSTKTIGIFEY